MSSQTNQQILIPIKQAGRMLGRSVHSIRNAIRAGELTPVRFTESKQGSVYLAVAEIENYGARLIAQANERAKLKRKTKRGRK
jgi:hypothetical protein